MADDGRGRRTEPGVDDAELEAFARRVSGPLRAVEAPAPAFAARLEARLRREVAGDAGWMGDGAPGARLAVVRGDIPRGGDASPRPARERRSRTVRLSPLLGLAAAAVLALAVSLGAWWGARGGGATLPVVATAPASPPARVDTVRVVQFVLVAPGAQRVALVGDFNDWRPEATPMSADAARGLWTVEVPLAAGRHQYAFVVDGARWVADPRAPRAVEDDFGTPSSVITIGERQS